MRLYRALADQDYDPQSQKFKLSSDSRALGNGRLSNDISLLDEIYSHVMPTHKLLSAQSRRIIFSFTDDVKIANTFLTRYPERYKAVGHIDFEIPKNPLNTQIPGIICIIPIFRVSDWISLASYYDTTNVYNRNYGHKTKLSYALIPSRWGALSLARAAREYAVICNGSIPELLHPSTPREESSIPDPFTLDLGSRDRAHIIDTVKAEIDALNVQQARKAYVIQNLQ